VGAVAARQAPVVAPAPLPGARDAEAAPGPSDAGEPPLEERHAEAPGSSAVEGPQVPVAQPGVQRGPSGAGARQLELAVAGRQAARESSDAAALLIAPAAWAGTARQLEVAAEHAPRAAVTEHGMALRGAADWPAPAVTDALPAAGEHAPVAAAWAGQAGLTAELLVAGLRAAAVAALRAHSRPASSVGARRKAALSPAFVVDGLAPPPAARRPWRSFPIGQAEIEAFRASGAEAVHACRAAAA
jgi:hypothetical protein